MPRGNGSQDLYRYLNAVKKYVEQAGTHGDTTTSAQTTAGGIAGVNVAAITNFTNTDPCLLSGSAGTEMVKINGTVATTPLPLTQIALVHPIGTRLVEAQEIDMGHIGENGLTFGGTVTAQLVRAATSRIPIATIPEPGEFSFTFDLLGWNNLNLQAVFGVPEGELGAGSAANPYLAAINGANIGTQSALQVFRFEGTLNDARTVWIDLCGAQVQVNVNAQVGSSNIPSLTMAGSYSGIIQRVFA